MAWVSDVEVMLVVQQAMRLLPCLLLLAGCRHVPNEPPEPVVGDSRASVADLNLAELDFASIVATPFAHPTTTIACGGIQPQQLIRVQGHTQLTPHCDLTGKSVRFVLAHSHSSLDCQGAQLSPSRDDSSTVSAITIKPSSDHAISDIGVANCHVQGYGHALHIRQYHNPNIRYQQGIRDTASNLATAPHDIEVINLSSIGSVNSGIFVGDHVYDARFSRLLVRAAGTVGLYLEFGSRDNVIRNSVFVDNGFRRFKPNREAIAVDSSAGNQIIDNHFIHNGAGAVLLYRNCFEHADDPSRSNHFLRTQSSRDNLIGGNEFVDEPVGVWVASRQSRNLKGFACGAYTLRQTWLASYHLDSAKDNRILDNRFVNVQRGIIVEDDGTLIQGNDFTQAAGTAVTVGSAVREASSVGAVRDTRLVGNQWHSQRPLSQQLVIRPKSVDLTQVVD